MITMGIRQTVGLFVHPLIGATGMSITEMSMALAIGQLMWGVFQPLFGAWADKRGPLPVLLTGALLLCLGQICTLQAGSFWSMTLAQGVLSPAGAAAGSFSILIGIVAGRLPEDKRSVSAASSMPEALWGSLPLRPLQAAISLKGYTGGLLLLAVSALASIVPSWMLCRQTGMARASDSPPAAGTAAATSAANRTSSQVQTAVESSLSQSQLSALARRFFYLRVSRGFSDYPLAG